MGKEGKRLKGIKRCSTSTDAESSDHKGEKPLQIAESELQNPETSVKEVKRCSTATDAEPSDHKDKKPLQTAESELENPETDVKKQKKPKKKFKSKQIDEDDFETNDDDDDFQIDEDDLESKKTSEIEKVKKSFRESIQAMKTLPDYFEKEEPPKKTTFECCFETEDSNGNFSKYVFVTGFDTDQPRDVIKSALRKHFESCGCQVRKVFVPIECETGVPLGFAFILVIGEQKALDFGSKYMGNCHLRVTMAMYQLESFHFPNFKGCKRCGEILRKRSHERFIANQRHGVRK